MYTQSAFQFDSSSPRDVVARLQSVAPPFEVWPTQADFGARIRVAPFRNLGLFAAQLRHGNVVVQPMRDMYSVNIPLLQGVDWRVGSRFEDLALGTARVCLPGQVLDLNYRNTAPIFVANINASFVHECLGDAKSVGRARKELSLSTAEGSHLFRILSIYWRDAVSGRRTLLSETGLCAIEQDIVAAFVAAAFPGASSDPSSKEMRRIVAAADDFIQAEIAQPLTVAAIAKAARTSLRTLHRAFLHELRLTPMSYVKRERLNAARRCLLAAESERTTVAETARQHGFFHLGRFAIAYRDAFGESPGQTLRA